MNHPQPGLFVAESSEHIHVEWDLDADVADEVAIGAVAAARRDVTFLGGPNVVWGIAPDLWRRWSEGAIPADVTSFRGVPGAGQDVVPVTQSSLWLWCHAGDYAAVWQAVSAAVAALSAVATVVRHVRAYKAPDSRDPTGFIDGTENPRLDEALTVALVPQGSPGASGSPILVQKWVHDLAAFEGLSIAAQQEVIGAVRGFARDHLAGPDVAVAVSGGADSLALTAAVVLVRTTERWGTRMASRSKK